MFTETKLTSTPQREQHIAIALRECASRIAGDIVNALPTCVACEHFTEKTELCRLADARPPARVIAHGCASFVPDIPF